MAPQRDYYQILGVPETATPEQIKRAYRRLAKKHHPDANPSNSAAGERFKEISEAHAVLADPAKRAQYDRLRKYGAFAEMAGAARAGPRPGGAGGGAGPFGGLDLGDLGSFGGLGDLFSSIFGGERRRERAGAKGETVETVVTLPFRVAALGGKVPITVPVTEVCEVCNGTGAAPGAALSACAECRGTGTITFGQGGFSVKRPCPACRGRGRIPSEHCGACAGLGDVRVEKRVMITVPSGTDSGAKVRLRGQGPRGVAGAPAGDLIVTFQVEPDRFFERDGLDIHCRVRINLAQALLGSRLRVRTLDGKHVMLRVPPGTQPGRKFRIKGLGIEKNGAHGDQFVEVAVELPTELTPEQERLLREFAELGGLKR